MGSSIRAHPTTAQVPSKASLRFLGEIGTFCYVNIDRFYVGHTRLNNKLSLERKVLFFSTWAASFKALSPPTWKMAFDTSFTSFDFTIRN